MDCSIVPLENRDGMFLVSTTDFFYPLVEDPYLQGRIACANVLSDMYSLGVDFCDTMLMTLAASRDMEPSHRRIVTKEMIRGFSDLANEANTRVTGGQTVLNPWPIIGGVAMSVCRDSDMIRPESAESGDVLVLTKALGTQLAVNAYQWLHTDPIRWNLVEKSCGVNSAEITQLYNASCDSMARLNRHGARLMHQHKAHAATDVTGFGLLGHAENLASSQKNGNLKFRITVLPIFRHALALDAMDPQVFKLALGRSAETSGGLLVVLPGLEAAKNFISDLKALDNAPAWVIGHVETSLDDQNRSTAILDPNCTVLEVDIE